MWYVLQPSCLRSNICERHREQTSLLCYTTRTYDKAEVGFVRLVRLVTEPNPQLVTPASLGL